MNIAVIGTGYVGLVAGTCFSDFGHRVICVDKDEKKIRSLKKGIMPIYEIGLEDLVKRNVKKNRLSFTTGLPGAVQSSLVVFVAVNTPCDEKGCADTSQVKKVVAEVVDAMDGYKVMVVKSTVPVGTCARIQVLAKERLNHRVAPETLAKDPASSGYLPSFDVVSNPEFLREGSAIEDFMRPNRVVIGSSSDRAIAIMKDIYSPLYLLGTPMVVTTLETAELIKYASNAFLAAKVSFINEIAALCEKVGADVTMVAKGMGLDNRIGAKFLHPSPGYGGSCFPKDTLALAKIAEKAGHDLAIVKATIRVNEEQKRRMVVKIKDAVGRLKGKTIGVLGLAFKPNTDDMRESASIPIITALQKEGARIRAFDPVAMKEAGKVFRHIEYGKDSYEVMKGSDALVILTEWNEFRYLDLAKVKRLLRSPLLIDTRNIYEPEKMKRLGFNYVCVGRC